MTVVEGARPWAVLVLGFFSFSAAFLWMLTQGPQAAAALGVSDGVFGLIAMAFFVRIPAPRPWPAAAGLTLVGLAWAIPAALLAIILVTR